MTDQHRLSKKTVKKSAVKTPAKKAARKKSAAKAEPPSTPQVFKWLLPAGLALLILLSSIFGYRMMLREATRAQRVKTLENNTQLSEWISQQKEWSQQKSKRLLLVGELGKVIEGKSPDSKLFAITLLKTEVLLKSRGEFKANKSSTYLSLSNLHASGSPLIDQLKKSSNEENNSKWVVSCYQDQEGNLHAHDLQLLR